MQLRTFRLRGLRVHAPIVGASLGVVDIAAIERHDVGGDGEGEELVVSQPDHRRGTSDNDRDLVPHVSLSRVQRRAAPKQVAEQITDAAVVCRPGFLSGVASRVAHGVFPGDQDHGVIAGAGAASAVAEDEAHTVGLVVGERQARRGGVAG